MGQVFGHLRGLVSQTYTCDAAARNHHTGQRRSMSLAFTDTRKFDCRSLRVRINQENVTTGMSPINRQIRGNRSLAGPAFFGAYHNDHRLLLDDIILYYIILFVCDIVNDEVAPKGKASLPQREP